MSRGTAILISAAAAAVAFPAAALGLHLPLWLDGGLSAAVFGGLYLVVRRPAAGSGLDDDSVIEARNQTGRGLLEDGTAALDRLRRSGKMIQDAPMRGQVERLCRTADKVIQGVRTDPGKAMAVRRLLTFYLPNAASLSEGWQALEQRTTPGGDRAEQTRKTMLALNDAFSQYADDLTQPQMQTLDLDLKVLNDALKSDLEKTP
jgi:hypothetical protein